MERVATRVERRFEPYLAWRGAEGSLQRGAAGAFGGVREVLYMLVVGGVTFQYRP